MVEGVDAAVIKRAQAGDEGALTALYEHYKPEVYRFLYYRTGDRHTAEDLTTEVFIRVLTNLTQYRQRKKVPFRAWLFQITRNLVIDHSRKMKVRNHVELNERISANNDNPERRIEKVLTEEILIQALHRLTDEQCNVIVLRFISEMPIREVAKFLNKSEGSVKMLQARGLESLRRIFAQRKILHDQS